MCDLKDFYQISVNIVNRVFELKKFIFETF